MLSTLKAISFASAAKELEKLQSQKKAVTLSDDSDFAFTLADTNGDGFLTSAEIQQFVFIYGGE